MQLYILADGGEAAQTKAQRVTSKAITARVAEVLSSVTASIRASADAGCSVRAINAARVGDYFAVCELDSRADITQLVEVDAVAEAGARPAALVRTCMDNAADYLRNPVDRCSTCW